VRGAARRHLETGTQAWQARAPRGPASARAADRALPANSALI